MLYTAMSGIRVCGAACRRAVRETLFAGPLTVGRTDLKNLQRIGGQVLILHCGGQSWLAGVGAQRIFLST